MRIGIAIGTIGVGLLGACVAAAAPSSGASSLALEWSDPAAIAVTIESGDASGPALGSRSLMLRGAPRSDFTRFRPRRGGYREGPRSETFSQLHLGFMDPDGPEDAGVVFGFRGGLAVDRNIQIGGQIDWHHRGNAETVVVSEGPGPGGTVITTRGDLSRSSSDLVPIMGFIQVSAADLSVIPYFGLGAGVEVLHLSATNFQTGEEYNGTFGGFGWQLWGGAAMPLSGRARLNAEVFVNAAELSRDVDDPFTGQNIRETVNMDGTGMRVGLAWGF